MAIKDNIIQAMAWKYPGAKVAKTPDGQDIEVWRHPTEPQPSKDQVAIDVDEFLQYLADEKIRINAFNAKKSADIAALGTRIELLAEIDAMVGASPQVKTMMRKLAEIQYSNEKGTID
jgi:hypothetical protein